MPSQSSWRYNMNGAKEPLYYYGLFAAGSSQAIVEGDILEFTGGGNTQWVPIDSDFDYDGNIAVAAEKVKAGDLAGYYKIIVPRPGDVFEYALASGSALAYGTAMTYHGTQSVTTGGSHTLATATGQGHYPNKQGHLAAGDLFDSGVTIRSTDTVEMVFAETASLWNKLCGDDST